MTSTARTLIDKIWDSRLLESGDGDLIYIDMHLIHEVTSPQAFEGLRLAGRRLRRPDLTVGTADHDVPTAGPLTLPLADETATTQLRLQEENCRDFGVELHPMGSAGQGIVHVIGPELGLTQPGMTIVCGDSHTATHGAFGAIAFGIGTSQVEHVMATQTLRVARPKTMSVTLTGTPHPDATAKDLALAIIARIGHDGGTGHLIEFRGAPVTGLSMAGRMTLCNMAIEAGARSGLIAPDETTFAWLRDRERSPGGPTWQQAVAHWSSLRTDDGARFDREVTVDVTGVGPMVTWGTDPGQAVPVGASIPSTFATEHERASAEAALAYMGLRPGQPTADIPIHTVFIGSCTNGRLEDLRAAADVIRTAGGSVARDIRAIVVPGSARTKSEAEAEGLDAVFTGAGFEWRSPGCSMCVGMNGDTVPEGRHAASTSNRNFQGRQGRGARTHLVSPETAAATALAGHLATPSSLTDSRTEAIR
ncbi:3-isopropylmalate dehydratase large subunit [Homoserinibacter sp. YIM 151385]|uniref:3-isopropylmalate dehydratase large subunit n=1 Tax=Homoserinibacter sp. YIM 151385 TaxID=2985506 RepID=UPI0022F052E2|nr:3-isopropylmalate dehydratase large subunit [Homoserinibacter sp. YIM 151385]WBU36888.1 3-isopropylmalate dehydratase large subunit [Homoserinibacter sp. YIM 151385]